MAEELPSQTNLSIDESPNKEGQSKSWIWTFVAASFTFFACRLSRAADVPKQLLGENFPGLINCDRARMYWAFGKLQYCWAHLKRDFQGLTRIIHQCSSDPDRVSLFRQADLLLVA